MGFWADKRVLVTGHTGFKGSWLTLWLKEMGARVTGLSLPAPTDPSLFAALGLAQGDMELADLRDSVAVRHRVLKAAPEIVFHLAAQPLVRAGYRDPAGTFATNVQGTAHLLEALRLVEGLRAIVVVTTDKVYRNAEDGRAFRETDPLGGHDPYSASKAACEILAQSWSQSFFAPRRIGLATARAGNVIGGGDWAEDRLVPDAVRAFLAGRPLEIRNPGAVRPWQHVLDPLGGYLMLAEQLFANPDLAGPWNFGPDPAASASVGEVLEASVARLGRGEIVMAADRGPHEAGLLRLDSTKAAIALGFSPRFDLAETLRRTWDWYSGFARGRPAIDLCLADLEGLVERPVAAGPSGRRLA